MIRQGKRPTHDEFYKAIKRACAALGYSEGLNVYSMRHTGCTRAARKNAGAKVQKFAGHKNFKTTLNYIHLEDEDMADVAMTMRRAS
jgi:integrase